MRPAWPVWLFVVIALLALGLRAPLVWSDAPLLPDEALFATFARHISHENNPLLLGDPVDKPPLTFGVTALSFKLFGDPSIWAARLPNVYASLLTVAAAWALARRLYRDARVAALAALIVALSPLDVALAATVFTDPQATLWALLACLLAVRGRWGWAGLSAGLAFACKQSAVQCVPLIAALGVISCIDGRGTACRAPAWLRGGVLFVLVVVLTFLWGAARGPGESDWWALGAANNAPNRLIRSDEVGPRLAAWAGFLAEDVGGPPLLSVLLAAGPVMLLVEIQRRPRRRAVMTDIVLTAYLLGYVLVYWLAAFNVYGRYAHSLVPLLALVAARVFGVAAHKVRRTSDEIRRRVGVSPYVPAIGPLILVVLMLPGALRARAGESPLWAERAQYVGITATAAYLNALPPGTIVYDHWLGWELGWYSGQDRPRDMWLRLTYYPTPEALIADALAQPDSLSRYFVVPGWVWAGPWLRALEEAGFAPQVNARLGQFTVYRLVPPTP